MFRMTLILCAGLFGAMVIGGEDRGQVRFGLMPQAHPATAAVASLAAPTPADPAPVMVSQATVAPVEIAPAEQSPLLMNASFAPEAPLMTEPVVEATPAAPIPETTGRILRVASRSLNVRAGPGTEYSVMDRLKRGDEVLVVAEGEGDDGWAMIRIEGDGLEGYVSARLLSE
jgi:hypothetical protein